MSSKKITNRTKVFYCAVCDYTTSYKKDYNKHVNTIKHRRKIGEISEKFENVCSGCGKKYKHSSGLSRHKKICKMILDKKLPLGEKSYPNYNGKMITDFSNFKKKNEKNKKNKKKSQKNKEKNKEKEKIEELKKKVESLETKLLEQKVESLETQLKLKEETINAYEKQS